LICWLITGFWVLFVLALFVTSYLSARKPCLGGPYFYVYEAFGKYPAAMVGWVIWISLLGGLPVLPYPFAGYMASL